MATTVKDDVDYATLAIQDPDFAAVVGPTGWVDFKDPKAVQALCKAIMKRDYGLQLQLADDRLTPFVPVRANYVKWIQELVDSTSPNYTDGHDPERDVLGIDIGTGASAIYALLCCRTRPWWRMAATDIDLASLTHAARNVALNGLERRIRLVETPADGPLLPLDRIGARGADFVICNPPFYASAQEMQDALAGRGKSRPPSTVCTGSAVEMVTEGGDAGFMARMVDESKELGARVQWYSAMPGKLESLYGVVAKLDALGCTNWATRRLTSEGGRTRRWAVAWSWAGLRPPDEVARTQGLKKEALPFPNEYRIAVGQGFEPVDVTAAVNDLMGALDVRWRWDHAQAAGLGLVACDVWSRHARRMKEKRPAEYGEMLKRASEGQPKLVVKVSVSREAVVVRWMRGYDRVLFESLCGTLKRQIGNLVATAE